MYVCCSCILKDKVFSPALSCHLNPRTCCCCFSPQHSRQPATASRVRVAVSPQLCRPRVCGTTAVGPAVGASTVGSAAEVRQAAHSRQQEGSIGGGRGVGGSCCCYRLLRPPASAATTSLHVTPTCSPLLLQSGHQRQAWCCSTTAASHHNPYKPPAARSTANPLPVHEQSRLLQVCVLRHVGIQ